MKLAVYEMSWLRNLQYDLEGTVKAGEGADPIQDLQNFIRENQSTEKKAEPTTPAGPQPYFHLGKQKDQSKTATPATIQKQKEQQDAQIFIRQLADGELQPFLRNLFQEGVRPGDAEKEQLDQLRPGMSDPRRRAALAQALRAEIAGREASGEAIETAKPIIVDPVIFDSLVFLFKAALDACDEQSDSWCGRDFMVLTQLFRVEGEGVEKPASLLSRIYNHALWNKVTFWEEVLIIGLCEAHAAESLWRRSLPAGSQFAQPAMTLFLQKFVGYMMAFGISYDQGRNSVSATLRKHEAMLTPTGKAAYTKLLLQAYEASPQAGANASTRALDESASSAAGGGTGGVVSTDASGNVVGDNAGSTGGSGGTETGVVGGDAGGTSFSSTGSAPAPPPAAEEDFEAVALGLVGRPEDAVNVEKDGAGDAFAEGSADDPGNEADEALQFMSGKHTIDDVFA